MLSQSAFLLLLDCSAETQIKPCIEVNGATDNQLYHPQEDDFEDMLDMAETMESHYGHLFDKVIVNGDIAMAFRELKADLKRIDEAEVQWIPAEWVYSTPTKVRRSCGHLSGWI